MADKRPTHRALQMQEFLRSTMWIHAKAELDALEKSAQIMLEEGNTFDEVREGRGMLRAIRTIPKRFEAISKEVEKE